MKERGFTEIGKRLLSIRAEMDQRGFARHVNVSQQAISNYERGNLPNSWSFLRKMNQDFNVNVNWLLTGEGQRDYRAGSPYAALTDNRPPGWPRAFLSQPAFADTDPVDILLHLYFFYLATEPADVKARLMADLQAVIDATRATLEDDVTSDGHRKARADVYDALARDDRALAIASLIRLGERLEADEEHNALRRALRPYLGALTLARLQQWDEQHVEAGRRVGRIFRKQGRWDEAERAYREILGLARDSGDAGELVPDATWARVWLGYGHVAKERGRFSEARERYTRALELALRTTAPELRAEVYLDLGCLAFHERDWQKALDFVGTGRAFAEQSGNARSITDFRLLEAAVLRHRGDFATAEAIFSVVLAQAERQNEPRLVAVASTNLAEVLVDGGDHLRAQALLERTQDSAEAHGSPRSLALRKLVEARIAYASGEEQAGRAGALECLRYARQHGLSREFELAAGFLQSAGEAPVVEASAG